MDQWNDVDDADPPAERLHYADGDVAPGAPARRHPEFLEIDTGLRVRWWRWIAYLLLFALVSLVLIWFMLQFGATVQLAIGLVLFMVGYMTLAGWLASRKI
ncbi:MAG TPA: hypothetical protein VIL86_16170 [Tepidisphaeraceae bacterium]|jgi:hypothetical protein